MVLVGKRDIYNKTVRVRGAGTLFQGLYLAQTLDQVIK